MKSGIVEIKGIGPVLFEKSKRAKRIILSVKSDKTVRVAVPYFVSFSKALDFTQQKREWVSKQLIKIENAEKNQKSLAGINHNLNHEAAKLLLVNRLYELAQKYGFEFNKVKIRNQKTRWGSCSSKNNINLNIKLAFLPAELRDYVLIHELVHTKIKNHGKEFREELKKYVKDYKKVKTKLSEFQTGVF